jgi:hypothetical protein
VSFPEPRHKNQVECGDDTLICLAGEDEAVEYLSLMGREWFSGFMTVLWRSEIFISFRYSGQLIKTPVPRLIFAQH